MRLYENCTPGSFIEIKLCSMAWVFNGVSDQDYARNQAAFLYEDLSDQLEGYNVEIIVEGRYVEVKPAGINKGTFVSMLLGYLRSLIDFALIVGDDKSDELMFESLLSHPVVGSREAIFPVVVGLKPSKAKYFLFDTREVFQLIEGLNSCTK